jgi:hypothetical protein
MFRRGRRTSAMVSQSSSQASASGVFCGAIFSLRLWQEESNNSQVSRMASSRTRDDVGWGNRERREHLATGWKAPAARAGASDSTN